jgi:DNA-binding transcriptional LysR family regulator
MAMDLRDIEYFAVLAEHGQLVRAAEALGLSQPALSLSLRRLEQSARARLVTRTPKGVELTAVGAALLTHVQRLRLARDDLAREVSDIAHGEAGHLRVGTGPATADSFLPGACSRVMKETPKVTVAVSVAATTNTLLPALRKGDLDIVVNHILQTTYEDLVLETLWDDEFVVYASTRHRLAKRKTVKLADLTPERWASTTASAYTARQSLQQTFEERGLPPPQISLTSDSVMLRHRTVASTELLGIGSRGIVEANAADVGLKIIPVRDMKWIRPVAVFYRKDGYLSPSARRFIEILKTTAKKNVSDNP